MNLTLLLDLDDTLLSNNMDTFLPAYLKALSTHIDTRVPAKQMIQELLSATGLMQTKRLPAHTLEQTFDRAFYPGIGVEKAELRETIDQFYQNVFPTLQPLTTARREAVELVDFAVAQGWDVVIATNPLFPATAVHQRLDWTGLAPDRYPFRLVTAYHQFHYAKPNPAYFAEILAQLGWPNQPAVMVGNSIEEDIEPASKLGLPCYWLTDDGQQPLPKGAHPLSASGGMAGIVPWLRQVADRKPRLTCDSSDALLAVLQSTPAALDTFTHGLTEGQWRQAPKANEWSLTEIVCHLRDVDREVNLPRLIRVLSEEKAHLTGIDTDPWAKMRDYAAQDGPAALVEFSETRSKIIDLLDHLSPQEWEKGAQHTIFGPTTLRELMSFIATHDRTHIQQ
ncbi:MAG TPA: DinB family protein, partial [Anaerolineaceae bacterium]|nr:DinB family protein [Anaerolineaceae bacterium]